MNRPDPLPSPCSADLEGLLSRIGRSAPAPALPSGEWRHVLLTGADGFVGRFVLRELLRALPRAEVHCWGGDGRRALASVDLWQESWEPRVRRWDPERPARIDAFYHLAGLRQFGGRYRPGDPALGMLGRILELATGPEPGPVFLASSMEVHPAYCCGFSGSFRESRIESGERPEASAMRRWLPLERAGSSWIHLVSEMALKAAHEAGLAGAVFRLPWSFASRLGPVMAQHRKVRLLEAMARLRMRPEGHPLRIGGEAADDLARIMVSVSLNPRRRSPLYHCCRGEAPDLAGLEEWGLEWRKVSLEEFREACRGDGTLEEGDWPLLEQYGGLWPREPEAMDGAPVRDRDLGEDALQPLDWAGDLTLRARASEWLHRHPPALYLPSPSIGAERLLGYARALARREAVPVEEVCPPWMQEGAEALGAALQRARVPLLEWRRGLDFYHLTRGFRTRARLFKRERAAGGIREAEMDGPVFIVGINRTGTTLLHRLMARSGRFRVLRHCDFLEPAGDRGREARYLDFMEADRLLEVFEGIHALGLQEPEEDFPLLDMTFHSWVINLQHWIPDYGRWLRSADLRPAYAFHRRAMLHFGHGSPGGAWLLKMPFHLMELESLVDAYPEARFIQTHRAPEAFIGSWFNLADSLRRSRNGPYDPRALGREQLEIMGRMLARATAFRQSRPGGEDRWADVAYPDLVRDPLGAVEGVFARFGWPLEGVEKMRSWLEDRAGERRAMPPRRYRIGDYGVGRDEVEEAFGSYLRFLGDRGVVLERDP